DFRDACDAFRAADLGDGFTRFHFSIKRTGNYSLAVSTAENRTVYRSVLEIVPAGVSHLNCRAFGFRNTTVGFRGVGYLLVADRFGNAYDDGTRALANLSAFSVTFKEENQPYFIQGVAGAIGEYDAWEGGYEVSYNITEAAVYAVSARWVSWSVPGSGDRVSLLPNRASPAKCVLAPPGAMGGEAGGTWALVLKGYDRFGNGAADEDMAPWTRVALSRDGRAVGVEGLVELLDLDGASLRVALALRAAGRYDVVVLVNGTQ
ncbi:unnamed protein product, partial [Ostreobium quekettii]